jgi:hypothetical protein
MLRQDLLVMRKAIRDFQHDKHRPPHDLDELVASRYLVRIPKDPMTGAADWRVTTEESVRVDDFSSGTQPPASGARMVDIHSSAPGRDADGKAWSEY